MVHIYSVYALYCVCDQCFSAQEPRYVGYSRQPDIRFSQHIHDAVVYRNVNFDKEDWIRRHFPVNIRYEIIDSAPTKSSILAAEFFWVETWRAAGADLLNRTDGGLGTVGYCFTEEDKAKISEGLLRWQSKPENLEKRREIWKQNTQSAEAREKQRQSMIKRWASDDIRKEHGKKVKQWYESTPGAKEIISESSKKMWKARAESGWTMPQETRDKIGNSNRGKKRTDEQVTMAKQKSHYCDACGKGPWTYRGLNNHRRSHDTTDVRVSSRKRTASWAAKVAAHNRWCIHANRIRPQCPVCKGLRSET